MRTGRPRAFDADDALRRITAAFWTRGYAGTSIADLEHETGLGRTSLYAAFGDKASMFSRALDGYWAARMEHTRAVLDAAPVGREAVAALLAGVVANLSDPSAPKGCLRVNSALEAKCLDAEAEARLRAMARELEGAIAARLVPPPGGGRAALDVARYVVVTINGLAVAARLGAGRDELRRSAAVALAALEDRRPPRLAGP